MAKALSAGMVSQVVGGALLVGLAAGPAAAKPAYKDQLARHYGPLLVKKLADCNSCHADEKSTEPKFNLALPKPHNAFGSRLSSVAPELAKKGKPTSVEARLDAIAAEDSDGDGAANLLELLTGHSPGAKNDAPTAAEGAKGPQLRAQLDRFRKQYAWRPFEPVRQPYVPRVVFNSTQPVAYHPIDAFLESERKTRGLTTRPPASKAVLLRRVYLDLVGLPPTREELIAFQNDKAPDAYEKVVDKLLASPRYGERWGRHWMDVWRYSDWDGFGEEVRNGQRHLWRWRDWIIDSLNADKPYSRMVQEMLAGDELAPEDPKILPATGFIVRNWYVFNRNEGMNKLVEGAAKGFLGLTISCARCHDHKYDPVSQKEYFAFRAFFESHDIRVDRVPGQADLVKDGLPHAFDANPKAETFLFDRGDERRPDKSAAIAPAVPTAFAGPKVDIQPVNLPLGAYAPDKREFVRQETLAAADSARNKARAGIDTARSAATKAEQDAAAAGGTPTAALALAREVVRLAELESETAEARYAALASILRTERLEDGGAKQNDAATWQRSAEETTSLQRKQAVLEARQKILRAQITIRKVGADSSPKGTMEATAAKTALAEGEKALTAAEAAAAQPATAAYTPRPSKTYSAVSSGRRLGLARWITDNRNPLAARVAMNHMWLRHFGKPLAPNVFDFGGNARRPTHPALLDWLASQFMAKGWSMKAMHRLMVTSSAYRMDSVAADGLNMVRDPDNVYLWRANSRRMEAEVVRDSLLHVAGGLDLTMGGPDLDQNQGLKFKRRSVYFRHSMEKQVEFLATFDQVPPAECYERTESVMPQQALALANSELAIAQARTLAATLAKQVEGQAPPAAAKNFVAAAFQQLLGRLPTAAERKECEAFLTEQASLLADPKKLTPFAAGAANPVTPSKEASQRARESLVQVLLNHNDFVTIR